MALSRRWAAIFAVSLSLTGAAVPASAAAQPSMLTGERWQVHAQYNGLVMDASGSGGHGSAVQLWPANGSAAQVWVQENAREGGNYLHPSYDWGLCLDFDGERGWGVPIKVNNCDGSASQRWQFFYHRAGGYELATHTDRAFVLDIPSSNFSAGQQLQLWGPNDGVAQQWSIWSA